MLLLLPGAAHHSQIPQRHGRTAREMEDVSEEQSLPSAAHAPLCFRFNRMLWGWVEAHSPWPIIYHNFSAAAVKACRPMGWSVLTWLQEGLHAPLSIQENGNSCYHGRLKSVTACGCGEEPAWGTHRHGLHMAKVFARAFQPWADRPQIAGQSFLASSIYELT